MSNERGMDAAFEAALLAGTVYPFLAAVVDTASGPFRCWTGIGDIVIGGETYHGAGDAANASPIEETTDVYAAGMTLQLNNISDEHIAILLSDMEQGRTADLLLGLLTADGSQVGTVVLFRGLTDVPSLSLVKERVSATISVESRLIRLQCSPDWFYTHEAQQLLHPGDLGFDGMNALQDRELKWGKA